MGGVRNTTKMDPDEALLGMMLSGSTRFIEDQEKQGQQELVKSTLLPTDMRGQVHMFEAFGFKFGEVVNGDKIFREATLPEGWKKVACDHDMWSHIVDDKGRRRAEVFYKAAFYDRSAHMRLCERYSIDARRDENNKRVGVAVIDTATGDILWSMDGDNYELYDKGRAWLKENRPDHEDILKSWQSAP